MPITETDVADLYDNDGIFETQFEYFGELYNVELEFDNSAGSIHGIVYLNKDIVDFYGKTLAELKIEFEISMNEYVDLISPE